MEVAKLRHRVTIQRQEACEDKHGFTETGWKDLKTVWCSINNLFGKEFWEAKKYEAENTVVFVMRYSACKDLSLKDRLRYKDKVYNITFIDNVLYRNELLKIKAIEQVR